MRVHDGEMRWPNSLPEIACVGKQRITEAHCKWVFKIGTHCTPAALRLHGNDCAGSGEGKKGEFLENER